MSALARAGAHDTFRSLSTPNFRLWFVGQAVSMIGYVSQAIGLTLLVLDLGGSGGALGLVNLLQFLPIVVLGPWAGVVSDRFDKRRSMVITQALLMTMAFTLAGLVLLGAIEMVGVMALAAATGTVSAFDQPSRRTIVTELVSEEDGANAVNLNGAINNLAKLIGPVVAGLLAASIGIAWCFAVNGATYIVVLVALVRMDPREIRRPSPLERGPGQMRDAFRYAWRARDIRVPLVLLLIVGSLSFSWNVVLPLLAENDFAGGAGIYALLFGSMSAGSLVGTLWLAGGPVRGVDFLGVAALVFGISEGLLAVAPSIASAAAAGAAMGAASMVLLNAALARVQLATDVAMRGRIMGLFTMVLFASLATVGPVAGWVSDHHGPRAALALGAVAALASGMAVLAPSRLRRPAPASPVAGRPRATRNVATSSELR